MLPAVGSSLTPLFILQRIEQEIGGYLFERDDEESETLSSKLLINYFQTINNDDELYPSFISLLESLTV